MAVYLKFDFINAYAPKPYAGPLELAQTVRRAHPRGVDQILIGESSHQGYKQLTAGGVVATLIGLLLPAVQRLDSPASAEQQQLRAALKPGGALGFVLANGTVRLAYGPAQGFLTLGVIKAALAAGDAGGIGRR